MGRYNLSAEALYVNGVPLEHVVRGYATLGVSGRELLSNEISTTERQGGDGVFVVGEKYPDRVITVEYVLRAESDAEFRTSFVQLNKMLGGGEKAFQFNDDMKYTYYGRLGEVEEVPRGTNLLKGSLNLHCADPFKYGEEVEIDGREATVALFNPYNTLPSKILVRPDINTSELTLRNGDKAIKLVELSLMAGNTVTFDFKELDVSQGGNSLLSKMTLTSDFENFYLTSHDVIDTKEPSTITVRYRERVL